MTSTDTLLPCPFCGGEARISRAHQNKMLAMGEVPTDEHYLFTLYHDCANGITICWTYKPKDALIAAWNRRTPPTPATDEREAVARAICALHCTECGYTFKCDYGWREVLPDADAALSALAPIRAAEILAAEARGMGRARTVVQNTRDGMKFDPSATQEWRNAITGGFNAADMALRHELDAMEDFDD